MNNLQSNEERLLKIDHMRRQRYKWRFIGKTLGISPQRCQQLHRKWLAKTGVIKTSTIQAIYCQGCGGVQPLASCNCRDCGKRFDDLQRVSFKVTTATGK